MLNANMIQSDEDSRYTDWKVYLDPVKSHRDVSVPSTGQALYIH